MEERIGWTDFNQRCNSNNSDVSVVGHMPMILNPAHEFDTLDLVIKRCMAISEHFGQKYTVITVD